jgi:hypothetical protein
MDMKSHVTQFVIQFVARSLAITAALLLGPYAAWAQPDVIPVAGIDESQPSGLLDADAEINQVVLRIETQIYEQDGAEPTAELLTMIKEGVTYEIQLPSGATSSEDVQIIDPQRGRIVVLDRRRQWSTKIDTTALLESMAKLRAAAEASGKPETLGLNAVPAWLDQIEAWEFKAGGLRYTAKPERAPDQSTADAFGQYADWRVRLNVFRKTGPLPFLRTVLNEHFVKESALPKEITLTVDRVGLGQGEKRIRVKHVFNFKLSTQDQRRIDSIVDDLATFPEKSWEEFNRTP